MPTSIAEFSDLDQARIYIAELEQRVQHMQNEVRRVLTDLEHGADPMASVPTLKRLAGRYRPRYRKADLIAKAHEWHDHYGEPPKVMDWNPTTARVRLTAPKAREAIARFLEGDWPHAATVYAHFLNWQTFMREAGYEPRTEPDERSGGEGHGHLPPWDGWEHVRHLRERSRLTINQAAGDVLSVSHWSNIENGKHTNPGIRTLMAMARGLGVRVEALL